MSDLLTWDQKKIIFINEDKTYLKLNRSNNLVSGYLVLESFDLEMPQQDIDFLKSLGFAVEDGTLSARLKLVGKRYLAQDDLRQYLPILDENYSIQIHYNPSLIDRGEMIALTPITITIDATMFLGEIALMPFGE